MTIFFLIYLLSLAFKIPDLKVFLISLIILIAEKIISILILMIPNLNYHVLVTNLVRGRPLDGGGRGFQPNLILYVKGH